MNRCCSFPLLSAPHSLISIWTNLKRSEKIPGPSMRRCGEWICLTGPSGLHRNSPHGLNISSIRVFDQIRNPEIPMTLRPLLIHTVLYYQSYCTRMVAKLGLSSWDEQRLRVLEIKVLRKIFRAKREVIIGKWRKLHNAELQYMHGILRLS